MSQNDNITSARDDDGNRRLNEQCSSDIYSLNDDAAAQQVHSVPRPLSKAEENIRTAINNCLRNWHEPWKKTFLEAGREFKIVYDLMDGLLHYEYQITSSNSVLLNDRVNAIAQAVARLIDYGNAILNIDLIIRNNDETSSEMDPVNVTTIELYQAHLKAHKLREKLLYDYFKKDKPNLMGDDSSITTGPPLQVNSVLGGGQPMHLSPTLDVSSHRSLIGSNSSINTVSDGRRTPQPPSVSQIEVKLNVHNDLTTDLNQLEITHMIATIKSPVFSASSSSVTRLTLLPGILAKIESLLALPTSAEKLSNCFKLLDALLDSIEKLPGEFRDKEVNMITTALLKLIVRKVFIDDRDNLVEFQHAYWTTCLLSMIRLMSANDFYTYLKHFNNIADLGSFLKDYLFIVKRIISSSSKRQSLSTPIEPDIIKSPGPTYPDCWIEMTLLAASTFLNSLTHLYQVLRQYFASNLQMWISFIDCLIHFILQSALKTDRQMLKERQRLFADDLRQTSAEYVWISWDSITINQKQNLLEDLIEPLLRACMTLNTRQRSILLPIFYDMMRCDYTSQYITPRGSVCGSSASSLRGGGSGGPRDSSSSDYTMYDDDLESLPPISPTKSSSPSKTNESLPYLSFRDNKSEDGTVLTKFTHLIVGKLNTLMIDLDLGDENFKNELCAAISGELNPKYYNRNSMLSSNDTGQFRSMARHTSDLIAEFMQICLDSRQANYLNYKHLYLLCLFKLILFFKDKVDRIELYMTNLYRLCCLHHGVGRFVEAGYTLLEHAKTLPWSDRPLENHYRIVTRFFHSPTPLTDLTSLKVFLYNTIIDYFDQGQLWEAAVPLCRELVDIYQFKTYEYEKLAGILQKMASYFKSIVEHGSRTYPEYFRVTFYGRGFPESLRGTTVVYRGRSYEKLGDFQATMLSKYPDAKLLTSLAKPDDTILNDPDARYLQINACSPTVDLKSKFGSSGSSSVKIEQSILNYYRHNECDKFHFSRRISKPFNSDRLMSAPGTAQVQPPLSSDDNFANMWRERTTLTTNTLPGMLPFFPVYLMETSIVSPIESAIEDLERTNDRLSCMVNRFKADKRQAEDVRLLGQLLLGIVDAAVNGGITKYEEAFFNNSQPQCANNDIRNSTTTSSIARPQTLTSLTTATVAGDSNLESNFGSLYVTLDKSGGLPKQTGDTSSSGSHRVVNNQPLIDHRAPAATTTSTTNNGGSMMYHDGDGLSGKPNVGQVDKLKTLIAQQVPLLDVAIQLHRDRVADVMRPQHEHLEISYKKLKHHVMSKYSRYLPPDYGRSTMRSFRTMAAARSPNRSMRSESRLPLMMGPSGGGGRFSTKRISDAGPKPIIDSTNQSGSTNDNNSGSSIPYKQLGHERRSLPFLAGLPTSPAGQDNFNQVNTFRRLPSPPPPPSQQPPSGLNMLPQEPIIMIAPTGEPPVVMINDVDDYHSQQQPPVPAIRTIIGGRGSGLETTGSGNNAAARSGRSQSNDTYVESPSLRIQLKQSYARLMSDNNQVDSHHHQQDRKLLDDSESRESLEFEDDEDDDARKNAPRKKDNSEKGNISDPDEVNLVSF